MSDNIGKHLFGLRGICWYRGLVVKETENFWTVRLPNSIGTGHYDRRIGKDKNDLVVDGSADIKACETAYTAAIKEHAATVAAAEQALTQARRDQASAARAALIAASLAKGGQP